MKIWFCLPLILTTFVITRAEEFTFGQDKGLLKKCIQDYLSEDSDSKTAVAAERIAEIAVHRFFNKSHKKRQFDLSINNMYYKIRDKKSNLFSDNRVPEKLQTSIREALKNCVERRNLPVFENEPRVIADFLDIVLVDWPVLTNQMVSNHKGRSILRQYAYSVGTRLMSALRYFSMDYDAFQRELRKAWMTRAQQYYDGYSPDFPYVRHRFTTDRDRLCSRIPLEDAHTIDNVKSLNSKKSELFLYRNPVISRRDLEISEAYVPDLKKYSYSGITSAEIYFEVHIDQCYRILFFILELQLRGINTDEDDSYDGPIPNDVMPFSIQDIVWHSFAYQKYLITWHRYFEQYPHEELEGCFSSGTTEELVVQLTLSIVKKTASTTTTSTSSTTTVTSTEFSSYEEGPKKGGIRKRDCRKYFLPKKRFRSMFPEENQQSGRIDNNFDFYGFILYNGVLKQQKIFEDQSALLQIFVELSFL